MIDRHLSLADRFDALIFDCDGTLVDSMPAHFEAWTRALTRVGITFTEQRFYELGGVTPVRIIETLAREANIELDLARVEAERDEHFRQLSDEIKGVAPVVDIARRHRGLLPMAVATGSCHASAEHSLAQLGIMRHADMIREPGAESFRPSRSVVSRRRYRALKVIPQTPRPVAMV